MTLETDLIVSSFPDNPSNNFIKSIYKLNQKNTPEVGSLSSEEELKSLIKMLIKIMVSGLNQTAMNSIN